MLKYLITAIGLVYLTSACTFIKKDEEPEVENKILAKIGDEALYFNDLPEGLTSLPGEDSSGLVAVYTDTWIRNRLLLQKAMDEIGADDPEIQVKIKNYTNSLLVQKYKEQFLAKQPEVSVTDEEIEDFYTREQWTFVSAERLYKGTFLKIPVNVPGIRDIRRLLLKPDSTGELNSFCVRYAKKYTLDSWFPEQLVLEENALQGLPEPGLETKTLLEKSDAEFVYLIFITEKVEKDQPAPLEYIKPDIRTLIINKKHLNAIENLENEIYNEGKKSGYIEIF